MRDKQRIQWVGRERRIKDEGEFSCAVVSLKIRILMHMMVDSLDDKYV